MTSYLASQDAVKGFLDNPDMREQEGVMFAYAMDEATLQRLVPAPLQVIAPVVAGYVTHMGNPSFARSYDEAVLYTMVAYRDKMVGAYPFGLFLAGPGAEMALVAGREGASIPKKLADQIQIKHDDAETQAQVIRHGTTLMDVRITPGTPNDPAQAQQLLGPQLQLNHPNETVNFFVDYQLEQQNDGTNRFTNTRLLATQTTNITTAFTPGKLALTLTSSADDPVGELAVQHLIGGGTYKMASAKMHKTMVLTKLAADKVAPYLITGRYDQSTLSNN
ncbi:MULTISPECIES: acetoacetate decarboxylase family protein [unclassified Ligilactobacillus]|uniref:acetoacetate decarboxylase family protein n=1 Tax=unclassified Ligilactobacillus TaxID=2767920 RepID=UPI003853F4D1